MTSCYLLVSGCCRFGCTTLRRGLTQALGLQHEVHRNLANSHGRACSDDLFRCAFLLVGKALIRDWIARPFELHDQMVVVGGRHLALNHQCRRISPNPNWIKAALSAPATLRAGCLPIPSGPADLLVGIRRALPA